MQKTKLVTMLGAVALVGAIGLGSTLAYLSDSTDTLTNTITVGNVDISLKESAVEYSNEIGYVDNDGNTQTVDASTEAQTNTYKTIVPGDTIFKDPTVTLSTASADSYVFLKVTGLDAADTAGFTYEISANWKLVTADDGKTKDGVYAYVNADQTMKSVAANEATTAFFADNTLEYPTEKSTMADALDITVKAAAVQASHVSNVPADAATVIAWN